MRAGEYVFWGSEKYLILVEYDADFVYLAVGHDGAALVHVSELSVVH